MCTKRSGVQLDFPALSLSASRFNGVLTALDISRNNLTNNGKDMSGILAIAEALKSGSSVLTSLNLADNRAWSGTKVFPRVVFCAQRVRMSHIGTAGRAGAAADRVHGDRDLDLSRFFCFRMRRSHTTPHTCRRLPATARAAPSPLAGLSVTMGHCQPNPGPPRGTG